MKQAILIVAYYDLDHLESIIHHFDDGFVVFIHIDKKTVLSQQQKDRLLAIPGVCGLWQRYNIYWGDVALLEAALFLCHQALKHPEVGYFHFISGQDLPIQNSASFKSYFAQHANENYIEYFPLPFEGWNNHPWSDGGFDRFRYWFPCRFIENIKAPDGERNFLRFIRWQHKLGISRAIPKWFPKLFGGSIFWSLNRESVAYVDDYTRKNPRLLKRMKYALLPEEVYFQTVLLNSPLRETIVNANLRFIDWEKRNGNAPAHLDETDFEPITTSGAFFARKFVSPVSDPLKERLRQWLRTLDQKAFFPSGS